MEQACHGESHIAWACWLFAGFTTLVGLLGTYRTYANMDNLCSGREWHGRAVVLACLLD